MILKHKGIIDEELSDKIVSMYNGSHDNNTIYLSSHGGGYAAMQNILDMINKHKENTVLIGYEYLGSAAFELFFLSECKRELIPGTIGMCHMSTSQISMNERNKPAYADDIAKTKWIDQYMKPRTKKLASILQMNKKEVKKITKKGYDFYFTAKRMKRFLTTVQE